MSGQIYFHISLQILAGISTFFYLRKIRLGGAASFCGAVFFELNGTFSWMANAAFNPIAFLPMALLGMELAIEAAKRESRGGWLVLCAGAVWSVYAGFPEVAFLDALLVAVYFFARASQLPRAVLRRLILKLGLCTLVTVLLISPLVAQFADFLSFSYNDGRSNSGAASIDPRVGVIALIVPYIYGPIGALDLSYWGATAGYIGFTMMVLAMAAVRWQWRNRVVQCFAVWAVICILKIYGEPLTSYVLLKIPLLSQIVLARWLNPSLEFSIVVLSATAIHELSARPRASLLAPVLIAIAILLISLWLTVAHGTYTAGGHFFVGYAAANLLFVLLFSLACCGTPLMGRHSAWVISSLGILEAVLLFSAPILSAPRNFRFDLEGVAFLQNHLGLQRFYTLGPILPNYGSAFGAAELNYDDMPVNKYLVQYFKDHLDPFMDATNTKPNWHRGRNPLNNQIIRKRLPAYGIVGVKYVVTYPGEKLGSLMRPVYLSSVMGIYELPEFTPYFSGRDCEVNATSRDEVEVRCLRPTTMVRLESFTPNWKASINGHPAEVSMYDGLFQSVEVPAGTSTVRFTYECPDGRWTIPMFWLGALGFVAVGTGELMARREVPAHGAAKADPKAPMGGGMI
ncbi:MAG TPA: hypothetical protein VFD66_02095, partial [Verrucomicrobiae bacterium]|nr:hypothetical protein [Verrucomicrobiae bacterium]